MERGSKKKRERERERDYKLLSIKVQYLGKRGFSSVVIRFQYEYWSHIINQLFESPIVESSPLYFS